MPEGLVLWGVKNIYYVMDNKTGMEYKCTIKGKKIETDFKIKGRRESNPVVVGDNVFFEKIDAHNGLITERLKRKNEFKRLKKGGRVVQTIFANIDCVIVMDSVAHPPLRPYFIDRCLFTAEYMNVPVILLFNKIDLLNEDNREFYERVKQIYSGLDYKVLESSLVDNRGIDELKDSIKGKLVSLNGRSGVGKSSLIKKLDPGYEDIKIGDISMKYDRGIHTTTFSRIYPLEFGAKIIDTPGIRELAIYIDRGEDIEQYVRDFCKYRSECRFNKCSHINEPGCRVLDALERGELDETRYESYLRMRETVERLEDSRLYP